MEYVKSNRLVHKLIIVLLILSLFYSCQSKRIQLDDNSDRDMRIVISSTDLSLDEKIEKMVAEKKTTMALQLVLENELSNQDDLTQIVINALEAEKQQYLDEYQFGEALKIEKSLNISGFSNSGEESVPEYMLKEIGQLTDKKEYLTASLLLEKYSDNYGKIPDDFIKTAEIIFSKTGNRKGLTALDEYYEGIKDQETYLSPESAALINDKVTTENLIEGTVTIWVDRGIKIENGLGTPDRVIGSGFFISEAGYILTNYHVIESEVNPEYEGYSRLFIKLSDERGERIPAKVVGWDRILDLAVLKAEISPPFVFHFSDDDAVPGDSIFAIGSPGGLVNTITSGTVSAKGRTLQAIGESIQIDVPINPGNSGGPLLNRDNEVVGVVFAGIENFENTNFAIPGKYVKKLLPGLLKGGAYVYPWTGIGVNEDTSGVEVAYIVPESPASSSSLKKGDRLVSINDREIKTRLEAQNAVLQWSPDTLIRTVWERNGKEFTTYLNLDERPDKPMLVALELEAKEDLFLPFFGMDVEYESGSVYKRYRIKQVYTGSIADEAHLSTGDMFSLRRWLTDLDSGAVYIQIVMSNRKAGFIESAIQFGNTIESAIFF